MNRDPNRSTRWRKGQSGNPSGRPRGKSITDELRRALDKAETDGRTRAEVIAETLVQMAIGGDFRAIQIVFDRTEGRAPDAIVEIDDDAPPPRRITVAFTDDRWDDDGPPAQSNSIT